MEATWFILFGILLVVMALSSTFIERAPASPAMIYLLVGVLIGPAVFGLLDLDILRDAKPIEHIAEVAVLISVFSSGLQMATSIDDQRWHLVVRLASVSMVVTVGLIAATSSVLFGLSLGAAILLGAMLAPTDAVLASDVQVTSVEDRDKLRFGLSGEAGMNDGTAFPFVMLGLGLLALHPIGDWGLRWLGVDLLWATGAGLAIGAALGVLVGRVVVYLRCHHREALGLDEFLTLGLIALSYGVALAVHAYGFLAVFAAGLALRRNATPPGAPLRQEPEGDLEEASIRPHTASAAMTVALLDVTSTLDRIGEMTIVLLTGVLISAIGFAWLTWQTAVFILILFLVIRPLGVLSGLVGSNTTPLQRTLISWFGIRGAGSLYYLAYAIDQGLPGELAQPISQIVLFTIAASIVVHGTSVTPLMRRYEKLKEQRRGIHGNVP